MNILNSWTFMFVFFFFQAEDGIRDVAVTGVQTCALPIYAQSRAFEEVFRRQGLRYKLVGGFSFYHRAEVKDALAYVRLAMHPEDDISLLRVLNVPPRGIGKTTVDALREVARNDGTLLWSAVEKTVSGSATARVVAP